MKWKNKPFCNKCNQEFEVPYLWCPNCNNLIFIHPITGPPIEKIELKSMWSLIPFLPKYEQQITLFEGNTPVIPIQNMENLKNLNLKLEFRNPTGSFRDRASALITSDILSKNFSKIISASTGSFGISLAAYSAKGQISSTNILPKQMDLAKIEQIKVYGSEVIQAGKNLDEAISLANELTLSKKSYFPTPNNNLLTIEGQKTIALELILQMKNIESIIVPRGSGTLILSIYRGFQDALASKWISKIPKIFAVSLKKSDGAFLAESLKLENPFLINEVNSILKLTEGEELQIDASEMTKDALDLAKYEGLFIEPASASVISAAKSLIQKEQIDPKSSVAILTGSGLNALNVFASQMRDIKKVVWGISEFSTQRFEILNLVAEKKANHGYAIWGALGKKKSLQSIYQHINNLVEDGLIIDTIPDQKKALYILTNKGQEMLEKMRDLIDLGK
ncbi:pyridoxal-phosphate dependent enzyme [Candidatus Lokiarchaeum ossiferum]|uniref:pyridoxal-phosphate dependent enzyme n=1 Tax=Candidatus Lokiarchaeum ossiferum TaxID=2951803 RepID=UPI00352F5792